MTMVMTEATSSPMGIALVALNVLVLLFMVFVAAHKSEEALADTGCRALVWDLRAFIALAAFDIAITILARKIGMRKLWWVSAVAIVLAMIIMTWAIFLLVTT